MICLLTDVRTEFHQNNVRLPLKAQQFISVLHERSKLCNTVSESAYDPLKTNFCELSFISCESVFF